jgi:NADPH-dependent 2,4-dienoyl-CoA reductase/sulfur reductase-like enzyme/nitrite reductase/ring-hydroxylating ferredoxin subunit
MHPSFQKIARLADLPEERGTRVKVGETPILLVRQGDSIHAYTADCPHAGGPLEKGALCNGRIVCPWHKGTFEISDGSLVEPPALQGLQRYASLIEDGHVYVSPDVAKADAPALADGTATMLVAGAGAAGAAACVTLREAGFDGRIVLAGTDAPVPYDRTALSKFVLSGDMPPGEVPPLFDPSFFTTHRIERIKSDVTALDASRKHADLADGTTIDYDAALICTGGTPQPLDVPGAKLANIHLLRNRDDASAIVDALKNCKRAVIVGASFIGLEAASCLRKRDIETIVVAPQKVPFAKQFGERIGSMFRQLHERNGVSFRLERNVSAFEGERAVQAVMLDNGERIAADVVIVGTGVKPATSFVSGIALADDGGIDVDSAMRAAPGLFAAGDVARFTLPRSTTRLRIEHWRVAQQHARVAAFNMAGTRRAYEGVPYFWTYHFGKRFDYLGHVTDPDDVIIDGELDAQQFIAYLLKDGTVGAVVACEREDQTARLAEAMRETLTLDAARAAAKA